MQRNQIEKKRMPNFVESILTWNDWFSKYYFGHLLFCFQPSNFFIGIVISTDKESGAIGILLGFFDIYWYFKKQKSVDEKFL